MDDDDDEGVRGWYRDGGNLGKSLNEKLIRFVSGWAGWLAGCINRLYSEHKRILIFIIVIIVIVIVIVISTQTNQLISFIHFDFCCSLFFARVIVVVVVLAPSAN